LLADTIKEPSSSSFVEGEDGGSGDDHDIFIGLAMKMMVVGILRVELVGESLYLMMILSFMYSCLRIERWGRWRGAGEKEEENYHWFLGCCHMKIKTEYVYHA